MAQINPLNSPMASARKRKRLADHSLQASPPPKKCKYTNFPPSFWDNLSKVSLTPPALRELDRRNKVRQLSAIPTGTGGLISKDITRFARHGGPDLRHLRGFQASQGIVGMESTPTSSRSSQTQPTKGTSRKSSAYGKDFEQHLADHNVYMNSRRSRPKNGQAILNELSKQRASLSPSKFSEGAFEAFQRESEDATSESDVTAALFPRLRGTSDIISSQNLLFTEPKPITDDNAVKPKPDVFDGAYLQDLSRELREDKDLRSTVIPTKHPRAPVAPNFYLEAKGPSGNSAVVQRQACYDGSYGVRAIHHLQNYSKTDPEYDGNAYTFSSTYHDGTLKLYSHHITAPSAAGQRPQYHMTQLRSFSLTDTRDTFVTGVTAFRNARDLAKQHRDTFIREANARATQMSPMIPTEATGAGEEAPPPVLDEIPQSADLSGDSGWQDADSALQQLIAGDGPQVDADTAVSPRYSKRPRQSRSPPAKLKRALPSTNGTDAEKPVGKVI